MEGILIKILRYKSGSYEGGWTAQGNAVTEFLQIDLGNVSMVTGIATQGNEQKQWWVTRYTLAYGNQDGNFTAYSNDQVSEVYIMRSHCELRL